LDAAARLGALGEPRQRRPHLATRPEDQDVALDAGEIGDQRRARRGHELVERLDAVEALRQRGSVVFGVHRLPGRHRRG
jgi:hypothetical protein